MNELIKKTMTCIVCPIGCTLDVTLSADGQVKDISGNTCKRGHDYALTEFTNPTRTLTSTVKLTGCATDKLLPVRTSDPIPKGKLSEAMKLISELEVKTPIKRGETLLDNFIVPGIKLISCKSVQ